MYTGFNNLYCSGLVILKTEIMYLIYIMEFILSKNKNNKRLLNQDGYFYRNNKVHVIGDETK